MFLSISLYIAAIITSNYSIVSHFISFAFVLIVIKIGLFFIFNIYNTLWKYASIEELSKIIVVNIVGNIISFIIFRMINSEVTLSLVAVMFVFDITFTGGTRIIYRLVRRLKNHRLFSVKTNNVLIVGAGDGGVTIMKEYKHNPVLNSKLVGFIDDDWRKNGKYLNGLRILGKVSEISSIVKEYNVDEIVIAMPSVSKTRIKEIISECQNTKCKIRILPNLAELVDDKYFTKQIREVEIEDLLGRETVDLNTEEICGYIEGKKVLVTGGGGSIGSELCRQIAKYNPKELILLDIYENNAYELQIELKKKYPNLNLKVTIASVRDKRRIEEIIFDNRPQVVFHAAAHKHVPLMEDNPEEAIKNNVFGTLNVVQASDKYGVENFVMISTDKAVNPTNIMGATKRLCEMIIQSIDNVSDTKFVAVRFGNVLGSNGSVIPLFKKQIAAGGPVLVTHPDIIRYFMTIPEASQLVIQAGSMAKGGEVFVLDMGEPVKILNLAKDLIRLSGFEIGKDIPIEIVGLRPGEKLYEELLLDEEDIRSTKHSKILIGQPMDMDYKFILRRISVLRDAIEASDNNIKEVMMKIVPTYKPVYNDNNDEQIELLRDEVVLTSDGE
ncbi:NAD-dependent epimerase/dehydratase family protein [Alkalibaculum sp. M08DMB]|uniref:NAD-dependent epimerase/dehydratase family protein n=2 Tax=Alkalibaculum sporogenes TaxID=2655001 RepID=A0A6A7K978_9FIRM|nr:NAD-dependent epimerase/dehydratase family protein [Alkalibaculum sporogenes]